MSTDITKARGFNVSGTGVNLNTGKHLILPQVNEAATPTLSFGDGDSGFYEESDDSLKISIAGTLAATISVFGISTAGGAQLTNSAPTATLPSIRVTNADPDTGVGSAGLDIFSLIAGGVEAMRLTESAGVIEVDVSGKLKSQTLDVSGYILSKGITWTIRTSAADNNWYSVCYGNGLFVAIAFSGTGNRVMTSPDGITWTIRTSAADNDWRSVCYGNGLFVAIAYSGTGNRVMTSPDGITWTIRTSAADNNWYSVCYGNGLFVAIAYSGTGNRVMTSPDGITWTIRTSAADNNWRSVCYGNGLFVAIAYSGTGNRVMTSPDGITWTIRTSAADNSWYSVCYGNGLFVAIANTGTGNRVMTSPDGITWTIRTSAADNNWYSVCYGNGLFVAIANTGTGNRVMTSPDGITWTIRTSAADNSWYSVCYGNGLFVAIANTGTGNRVMTSGKPESTPFSANNIYQGGMSIFGTVGINTTVPNANSILDLTSTTKAFMPPRMTTVEKAAIASPTSGMMVYDSTLNKLCVYGAAAWETITSVP